MSALRIFDICQTYSISFLLIVTILLAGFVYAKLLFYPPHSRNYTFKLIVFNGISELFSCLAYLIVYQLTSFSYMYNFYAALKKYNVYSTAAAFHALLEGMALSSSLFIALNRFKAFKTTTTESNFKLFFYASLLFSPLFPITKIVDLFTFAPLVLEEFDFGYGPVLIQITVFNNNILYIIYNVQIAIISCVTLFINGLIASNLIRESKMLELPEYRRNKAEQGLMITSIVSYIFYTLYLINTVLADYLQVGFCAYSRYLFLGVASTTPFWCLIIFAPTIRRSAFHWRIEKSLTTVHSLAN